jgi:hypothetical protein
MELLILLAVLVCPVVMGTMMLLMWRGMRGHGSREGAHDDAVPRLEVKTSDDQEVARR